MCKVGKFHALRWFIRECITPIVWILHGMADLGHNIDDSHDNKGKKRRPSGYSLSQGQRMKRLPLARAIRPYAFLPRLRREEQTFEPLGRRLSIHQTGTGRMHVMSWRDPPGSCMEPDVRNAPVRNL